MGLHRIDRYRLFDMLVADIRYDKQLKNRVSEPVLHEIIDRSLDRVCDTATMAVQTRRPEDDHHSRVGLFGKDEPLPG